MFLTTFTRLRLINTRLGFQNIWNERDIGHFVRKIRTSKQGIRNKKKKTNKNDTYKSKSYSR